MSQAYLGEIRLFTGTYAPYEWAYCMGQIIPIAQNSALFAVIGDYYGGDGRATMGLPRLIGRTAVHAGRGPGLTDYPLGALEGLNHIHLSLSQLPAHSHAVAPAIDNRQAADTPDPSGNYKGIRPQIFVQGDAPLVNMSPSTVGGAGQSAPHQNRQPYLGLSYIICFGGLFPPRN